MNKYIFKSTKIGDFYLLKLYIDPNDTLDIVIDCNDEIQCAHFSSNIKPSLMSRILVNNLGISAHKLTVINE